MISGIYLSRFRITKFEITETLLSCIIIIFKTIIMPLLRAAKMGFFGDVVHLYSSFSIDPQDFPLGAILYPKLAILAICGGRKPPFLKPQR